MGMPLDEPTTSSHGAAASKIFKPIDRTKNQPSISLPNELWITVLESTCTFNAEMFSVVMLNLIKNPNITASHLFRADVLYDREEDHSMGCNQMLIDGLQPGLRPIDYRLAGFDLTRTIVRRLIPRNPQLDAPLVQTCHFFTKSDGGEDHNVVLYIPHVERVEDVPFYHPAVSMLTFEHRWKPDDSEAMGTGSISVTYRLFPESTLTTKLERTALRLLETVHKHGQGQLAGYEKRVHLDQVIPQKRYQDTYTRLKTKYGKQLSEQWVEVTDPGKHVFEDIGIAAFLIELWRDMYPMDETPSEQGSSSNGAKSTSKTHPPHFVDIGCGNGVLVYILLAEGYEGWGFDARERKTWSIFPDSVQKRLQRRLLIPKMYSLAECSDKDEMLSLQHDGTFPPDTFIISNHADELTAWTPVLAYMSNSAFIAIPCCSHDLSGSRFRAPASTKRAKEDIIRLPQHIEQNGRSESDGDGSRPGQAAETGSLKRTEAQKKMPSAYATLCSYVESLAEEVGFKAEREVLRIPSTRNQCIIGRQRRDKADEDTVDERERIAVEVVERELKTSIDAAATEWVGRCEKLARKPGSGH